MSYVELSVEAEFDATGEQAFVDDLKSIEGVERIQCEPPLALGAAIIFGIKVAAVAIPAIIAIAQKLRNRPRVIKFKCPGTKEKVKISFEGIEDVETIEKMVKDAYEAECGK